MHSKQTLAVLTLAASTAIPVLSAPLPEKQERARAELEARLSLGPILKTIGINAGLGAIPAILDKVTRGDDKANGGDAGGDKATGSDAGGDKATGGDAGGDKATGGDAGGDKATGGDAGGDKATGGDAGGDKAIGGDAGGDKAAGGDAGGDKATGGDAGGDKATGGDAGGDKATGGDTGGGDKVTGGDTGVNDNAARELTAREELEARLSLGPILKTIGINAGLGAVPAILDKVTGGDDNAARELTAREELEARLSLSPILNAIGISESLGAIPASEIASKTLGSGDNRQRDLTPEETLAALSLISKRSPEPFNLAGIGKGIAGLVAGLVGSQVASGVLGGSDPAQRDLTPEETLAALGLIDKRSPEPLNLAGIGKGLAGIVAGLAGSQIAQGVLGGSDPAQRDLTPEETLAALSLISKREISLEAFKTPFGFGHGPVVLPNSTLNQLD